MADRVAAGPPPPFGRGAPDASRSAGSRDGIRRLEALLRRGWPALETECLDGWLLGASGGYTRRANSVSPERFTASDLGSAIERVEAWYAARGRLSVFKLTAASEPEGLEAALAERGYARGGETLVMEAELAAVLESAPRPRPRAGAEGERSVELIAGRVGADWLAASCALSGVAPDRREDYRAILDRIVGSVDVALFGDLRVAGRIGSLALGSVVGDTVQLAQVATRADERGAGLAEQLIRSILYAAGERGAQRALLPVEAGNAPARRLYDRLGFSERYRYAYRQRAV